MKKTIALILSQIIIWMAGCTPKSRLVPEITSHLNHSPVYSLKEQSSILKLLKSGSDLVLVDSGGKISKLNIETGQIHFIFQLKFPIAPEIFSQNGLIIFREALTGQVHIFELKGMKIVKSLENVTLFKDARFIGINERFLLIKGQDGFVLYDYPADEIRQQIKVGKERVFNCEFQANRVIFLTEKHLYIYDQPADSLKRHDLKARSTSGFLVDRKFIYYGSDNRELVKMSLNSGQIKWKFRLPEMMRLMPRKLGKYITVTPEDQNVYFFNPKGTLYWWQKLDSTRLLPPVLMEDHLAVFLFPPQSPSIKYFNYKKKETFDYDLDCLVKDRPVFISPYLYVLTLNETRKMETVTRVGNRFAADIKSDPKNVKIVGRSVKFELVPINLFKPSYSIDISNDKEESLFTTNFSSTDIPSFIWIPPDAGKYKMSVGIEAKNQKQLKTSYSFEVIDLIAIIHTYFQKLQAECRADTFYTGENSELNGTTD